MKIQRRSTIGRMGTMAMAAALMLAPVPQAQAQAISDKPTSLVSVFVGADIWMPPGLSSTGAVVEIRDEGLLKKKATGFKLMAGLHYDYEKFDDGGKLNVWVAEAGVGYEMAFLERRLRVMPVALVGTQIAWYDLPPNYPTNRSDNIYNPTAHFGVDVGYRITPTVELAGSVRRYVMVIRQANVPIPAVHVFPDYNLGVRFLLGTPKK